MVELYEISVANGLQLGWVQTQSQVGNMLLLKIGKDLGLPIGEAPSLLQKPLVSAAVNYTNISTESMNMSLTVFAVYVGTLTLMRNQTMTKKIAVLDEAMVNASLGQPSIPSSKPSNPYGGNFWNDLWGAVKTVGSDAYNMAIKPLARQFLSRTIGSGMGYGYGFPNPEEEENLEMEDGKERKVPEVMDRAMDRVNEFRIQDLKEESPYVRGLYLGAYQNPEPASLFATDAPIHWSKKRKAEDARDLRGGRVLTADDLLNNGH